MKNNYYFSHDSNARNDEKILQLRSEYGNEAYAIYFFLLESMSETEDGYLNSKAMGGLSLGYSVDKQKLKLIVEMCIKLNLLIMENGLFTSKRMQEHLKFRKKLKRAGEKGAKTRWKNSKKRSINQLNEDDSQVIRGAIATPIQRKGKERKEKESILLKKINKKRLPTDSDFETIDIKKIQEDYQVPESFVLSKWDDLINYCHSKNIKYVDFNKALRNFVKNGALKIKQEQKNGNRFGKPRGFINIDEEIAKNG